MKESSKLSVLKWPAKLTVTTPVRKMVIQALAWILQEYGEDVARTIARREWRRFTKHKLSEKELDCFIDVARNSISSFKNRRSQ